MMPTSLYEYIWRTTRDGQIRICLFAAVIAPLAMVPLELQRRIVDVAVGNKDLRLLIFLGLAYLVIVSFQGGLKFVMNVTKGRVLEEVARDLRTRILKWQQPPVPPSSNGVAIRVDEGTKVSMLAAESENVGGFAAESLSMPLLQVGTIVWVIGYLLWVEPAIAALAVLIYAPQFILVPRIQHRINRLARNKTSQVRRLGDNAVCMDDPDDAEPDLTRRRANILVQQIFRTRILIYRHK